jgi:prolyl oligopeptidase
MPSNRSSVPHLHYLLGAAASAILITCTPPPPQPTTPEKRVAKVPKRPTSIPASQPRSRPAPPSGESLPLARRQKIVETIHGQEVRDPYRWLELARTRETQTWVAGQDAYARRILAGLPGRAALADRLKALSYLDWVSSPTRKGKRFFFTRQHADKEKAIYYWREGERGAPKVLLDPNTLSKDGSVAVRGVWTSYDGKWAAYKLSENASDASTLHVMEVETGKISTIDTIPGARYAEPSWNPDGSGFYYTRLPVDATIPTSEMPGHAAVYYHTLGTDPSRDILVRRKTGDPRTFLGADLSRDGRFLFLYIQHGWSRSDVYYLDLQGKPHPGKSPFKRFIVGRKALYSCYAWKGQIYVHTNDEAPRYRLYKVDPQQIERTTWREIVPERPDAVLEDFGVVGDHLSLRYLRRAITEIEIATLEGKRVRRVSFPGLGSATGLHGNPEDDTAYYSFSSFTLPSTVYRTSVKRGGRKVYFKLKVPIDPKPYKVEQVEYPSRDGTRITMFIVRRAKAPLDGTTPMILTGYGGFNISLTPSFSASRFVWLEQGGAIAIPNLRGGGEYGEAWHQAGMLLRKQNTFDDFIAAAETLIKKRHTSADRLAIVGGSNGGLLVGAAMIQRPELFRAVACHVPLLDMVRYHLFGSGKTWISEYGSSDDAEQFRAIHAYSPYHHLKPGARYPALLMMSADSDDRVDPMHARKFTAAAQHASSSGLPVLLRVESNAGHGGGDMIKKHVESAADEYAFLMHQLGVTPRLEK